MNYGLIGEKLGHSFSADIHGMLGDYGYQLKEISPDKVGEFMQNPSFKGINVTIPYKQTVIPFLSEMDEGAKTIGAVNTVVNKNGKLYGYNTDFYGMLSLLKRIGAEPKEKKTLILGTGGTSKTAVAVVKAMGGTDVYRVSRGGAEGALTYDEAMKLHSDADIIINTTPAGMYPKVEACPIDIDAFPRLSAVADAVYNPLRSRLVLAAQEKGIAAEGGLYMLVAQAVRASELFLDVKYDAETVNKVYQKIRSQKENIVLVGMPSCGKTTIGAILAAELGRQCIDTDKMIETTANMSIPQIFATEGEKAFRDKEYAEIVRASLNSGVIIATGGGAVLRTENIKALKQNGRVYFIDRPLQQLMPTDDRPLAGSIEAITARYNERYGIYTSVADVRVDNSTTANAAAAQIKKEFCGI